MGVAATMSEVIYKTSQPPGKPCVLADYAATCREFDWTSARALLDGLPNGRGLNIAYEAVDRHVLHGRGDAVALRWIAKSGAIAGFQLPDARGARRTRSRTCSTGSGLRPASACSCWPIGFPSCTSPHSAR